MATWAVTINNSFVMGNCRVQDITIVATGTYTASGTITNSGDSLTPASCGLDVIVSFQAVPDTSAGSYANNFGSFSYNITNSKVMLFTSGGSAATDTEMTNGTTITGTAFRCLVYGF